MKLYLAGPMRGYPLYNFPAFDAAERRLAALGHEVWSPAQKDRASGFDERLSYTPRALQNWVTSFLPQDLAGIIWCEALALLPGWEESKGCAWERYTAQMVGGRPLLDAETGQPLEKSILQEAQRIVSGSRHEAYGSPSQDFGRTAALWTALLGTRIGPEQVAQCMIALKLSREVYHHGRDNLVDIAGYAACLQEVHERESL